MRTAAPPDPNPFTAMVQSGRELRKRWLTYDATVGSIRDGEGFFIAAVSPTDRSTKIASNMVAAYNESIARD